MLVRPGLFQADLSLRPLLLCRTDVPNSRFEVNFRVDSISPNPVLPGAVGRCLCLMADVYPGGENSRFTQRGATCKLGTEGWR